MGDNNDRSVLYNNAGVRLMDYGNYSAALEMFRGALETKLIHERTLLHNSSSAADHHEDNMDDDYEENYQQRCVSPDGSDDSTTSHNTPMRSHQRNDNLDSFLDLLRNMDDQQMQNDLATTSVTSTQGGIITSTNSSLATNSSSDGLSNVILRSFRGYEPYLYRIPFHLPGNEVTPASLDISQAAQSISCRIVFNLGLIHQTVCRTSCKVASFYEIAATLLSSLPSEFADNGEMGEITVLLRIAILNNFGVW